jgi:hypothetical protein
MSDPSPYAIPLEQLVGSAHVPVEDQVEEKATEPPVPDVVPRERVSQLADTRASL